MSKFGPLFFVSKRSIILSSSVTRRYTENLLTDAAIFIVPVFTPNTLNGPSYTARPSDTTEFVQTQKTEINISEHWQTAFIRKVTKKKPSTTA